MLWGKKGIYLRKIYSMHYSKACRMYCSAKQCTPLLHSAGEEQTETNNVIKITKKKFLHN